jgi:pyruvate,water dikinase
LLAVVGCGDATDRLKDGVVVTVSCAEGDTGFIYEGLIESEITEIETGAMPRLPVKVMMNVGNPRLRLRVRAAAQPAASASRGSSSSSINNDRRASAGAFSTDRPMPARDLQKSVARIGRLRRSGRAFFVEKLAEGVATIAAAFWPKPVIVRLSDFKSNEYAQADRRLALRAAGREPDARIPRRVALHRADRSAPASNSSAGRMQPGARRDGAHQRGGDGARSCARSTKRAASSSCSHRTGLRARRRTACRLIMMCELPSNAILADDFLAVLRRLLDRLERPDAADARARPRLGHRRRAASTNATMAVKALLSDGDRRLSQSGQVRRDLRPGPVRSPGPRAVADERRGSSSISLNPDTVVPTWQRLATSGSDVLIHSRSARRSR